MEHPMSRLTRRVALVVGGAALGVVAMAGTAWAHTEAEATAADAGRTRITFTAEAECGDGALPTSGLRVQLPQGATDVQPSAEGGWTTQVTATEVAWSSSTPAGGDATFVVEMVLAQPVGDTVYLPAIQACPDGTEIAWIQIPTSPGEKLQNPAPEIEVPANATTPTSGAAAASTTTTTAAGPTTTATMALEQTPITLEGSKSNSAGLIVFAVVVVVIVGGALFLFLRYRSKGNQSTPPDTGAGPGAAPPTA
jgi:uncharacterized protein YcnI